MLHFNNKKKKRERRRDLVLPFKCFYAKMNWKVLLPKKAEIIIKPDDSRE